VPQFYGSFNLFEALGACCRIILKAAMAGTLMPPSYRQVRRIDSFRQRLPNITGPSRTRQSAGSWPELLLSDLSLLSMEDVKSLRRGSGPCGGGNPNAFIICVCGAVLDSMRQSEAAGICVSAHNEKRSQIATAFFFSLLRG
jgi:hypothetical protein